MGKPLYIVDAFTDRPFAGNPAAVCLLESPGAESWMQDVAAEMNLSETAFLAPAAPGVYSLRWFTPRMEVDLCGHATLASAHVLWESGEVGERDAIRFETRSGVLGVEPRGEWIRMDFPADPPKAEDPPSGLAKALGVELEWFGRSRNYHFARVASEADLGATDPEFARLRELVPIGICVTAAAAFEPWDFVSRFFAPGAGIDEDPVTGSAHCLLAPHWGERLGKTEMRARQISSRGGTVRVSVLGDRVAIDGQAVTVVRGELTGC